MDPVTHALTGLALARAGLNRLTPRAAWLVAVAAVAPDIDFAPALIAGDAGVLEWHRGPTHSFVAVPVLALLCVALFRALRQDVPWIGGTIAAAVGVLGHVLLDELNPWGVRWLWPFTDRWFHLDILSPRDPWLAVTLLVMLGAPHLSRLVSAEIGASRTSGRGSAIAGLLVCVLYLGGRQQAHLIAQEALQSRVYGGLTARRIAAAPEPYNPLAWRGLVATSRDIRVVDVNLLLPVDPDAASVHYPADSSAALAAAFATKTYALARGHLSWSQPETIPDGDNIRVRFEDLRVPLEYHLEVTPSGGIVSERVRIRHFE
jgi:inner membrane protein